MVFLHSLGHKMAREMTGISGYIFKARSPSCGVFRTKVHQQGGRTRLGRGLFAAAFMATQPLLPVEEEGRFKDPALRENFIERVLAYRRWQALNHSRLTHGKLVAFHTAHKLSLLAHGTEPYRVLGRLVAQGGNRPLRELAAEYISAFMAALAHKATPRRHANVLQHVMGYLKQRLDAGDKAELLEAIEGYRLGQIPLTVPLTLLQHHFRRHPDPYISVQVYLSPHPVELLLRNQI